MSKIGGKAFDIEVLTRSPWSDRYLSLISASWPESLLQARAREAQLVARQDFIARELREDIALLHELTELFDVITESQEHPISKDTKVKVLEGEKRLKRGRERELVGMDFPQIPQPYE
jgi:hypothetical protein